MPQPGALLQNRYLIVQQIGGGGMGVVYLAQDTRLDGRLNAVKEMSPAPLSPQNRPLFVQAFKQEARILARLSHPGLTAITDFFEEGSNWYLVMDYVEGQTLEARLQHAPDHRLPPTEVWYVFQQLCDVLAYLHGQTPPVVFRDLKPSNVMLTPSGQVKLIDFGIARFFKPGQTQDTVNIGTPGYASPEQWGIGQTDPRSDIYSLGVLLHQLLSGHNPALSPFNLPDLTRFGIAAPPAVTAAIRRATAIDPNQRFASIEEMRHAMSARTVPTAAPSESSLTAQSARSLRWPLPWPVVAGLVVAILLVGILGTYALTRGASTPPVTTPESIASQPTRATSILPPTITPVGQKTQTPSRMTPTSQVPTWHPTAIVPTVEATVPSKPQPQIVFYSNREGNADIYIMNVDGSSLVQLTTSTGADELPVVSPDGQRIVFQSARDGNMEIYIMDRDGTNQQRLTFHQAQDQLPNWSPDGQEIIFSSNRDGNFELYVMDADGNNLRRLTYSARRDGHASWSSDGWIVFNAGDAADSSTWEIFITRPDGSSEQQLTSNRVNDWSPNWSPNGRFILFLSKRGGSEDPAIWAMGADGGNPYLVHNTPGAYDWGAVWSPDGRYIAFTCNAGGRDEVYLLDLNTGDVIQLTHTGGMYPSWAP